MLKAEVYTFEENKQNSIKKNRRAMLGHRHLLNFLEVEVACSVCVFYYLLVAFCYMGFEYPRIFPLDYWEIDIL